MYLFYMLSLIFIHKIIYDILIIDNNILYTNNMKLIKNTRRAIENTRRGTCREIENTMHSKCREIALDTETTGLSFAKGDRIIEIGCVEIIDKKITNNSYHVYINPERSVSIESTQITGLTNDFLKEFKTFKDIYKEFLDFIQNDRLVIHNAPFDMSFINWELGLVNYNALNDDTNKRIPNEIIDTLSMSRKKYPGSPATLDALCKKFNVDSTIRSKHGALIDAELLAQVYIIMSVEKIQMNLFNNVLNASNTKINRNNSVNRQLLSNRKPIELSAEDILKHREFIKKLNNPIWHDYIKE